jgi:hypothetical protein
MQARSLIIISIIMTVARVSNAQQPCALERDTMTLPFSHSVVEGEYTTTKLKKSGEVTFFRASGNKMYLKFLMKENLYFDKVDVLEIRSGTKSYYATRTLPCS